jgi:protein-disulfide isomerase
MTMNLLSRRWFIAGAALFFSDGTIALAQAPSATADDILAASSPLGDIVVGRPDAPLSLVQYASASCSYSAKFQREILPELNRTYIQTGKLKLVFRELPQNDRVTAVTLLARCLPRERFFDAYSALFQSQDAWVSSQNPGPPITRIVTSFGMSKETFEKCLADHQKAAELKVFTRKTVRDFNIEATPTFFLNGQKIFGRIDMADLRSELLAAIDAALKQ